MEDYPVLVFDLDGVITHTSDSSVDQEAVGYIHDHLQNGHYVAVNTGRPYKWVQLNLLSVLEEMGGSSIFKRLFIACEKGGVGVVWVDGEFRALPSRFALSEDTHALCHQLYEEHKARLGTMFWDDAKTTMATLEKRPEADFDQFKQEQQFIAEKLRDTLAGQDVKVDVTTVATDVESPAAGKHAGAELIYTWIQEQAGPKQHTFISFGDSRSDYEMARHFAQKDCSSTFVFVGGNNVSFDEHPDVKLTRTAATYANGTLEYFRGLST